MPTSLVSVFQTESVGRVVFDRLSISDRDEGDNAVVTFSCYIPEEDEDVSTYRGTVGNTGRTSIVAQWVIREGLISWHSG